MPKPVITFCVQSATQRTASVHTSHMPKAVITFVFKVLHKGLLRYILHTCPNPGGFVRGQSATQRTASVHTSHMPKPVITFCVQSATQRTASVHTSHMPKAVITFVLKVLRKGLLRYILYTCPNL